MYVEHIIYSLAIALIVGYIYYRYTGKDPSWIIVVATIFPDLDYLVYYPLYLLNIKPEPIVHGSFHTIWAISVISIVVGYIFFKKLQIPWKEASAFIAFGMICHCFEDALVYKTAYWYFFPFSKNIIGWGFMQETGNILGIAGTEVMLVGLLFLGAVVCGRMIIEPDWNIINHSYNTKEQLIYYTNILLNGNPIPVDDNE